MLLEHTHYRSYLNDVLANKCAKNPRFSLRSFAKQIEVSPSGLSRILNGKRKMTTELATHVSTLLGHSPEEASYFLDLVLLDSSQNDKVKSLILNRIEQRRTAHSPKSLTLDAFKVISDWYHYAILALTKNSDFKNDPHWIAKRLGISIAEVRRALERLLNLDLLEEADKTSYRAVNEANITTTNDISSAALKNHHRQMITKALEAVDEQSVEERDITSITVSFDPKNMKKTKKMIQEFRKKMNSDLDQNSGKDVYQLNIQFFKLTKGG